MHTEVTSVYRIKSLDILGGTLVMVVKLALLIFKDMEQEPSTYCEVIHL